MGNMQCPPEDAAHLAAVARDICPFPNYNPSPLFVNMLSINSSAHLRNHYTAVQSSLTPKQLEEVVALSLAVLFDTLAKQARGEWVSESEPIPGLFVKDLRGYYPPNVYMLSKYLRLVPHIANNPTRIREETARYIQKFNVDDQSLDNLGENTTVPIKEDITHINMMLGQFFASILKIHLIRIKNGTADELIPSTGKPYGTVTFNFNCKPEAVDKEFLAEVQKSDNRTQEAFERCKPTSGNVKETWLHYVVYLEWTDIMTLPLYIGHTPDSMIAQIEDFDLKAYALGKWAD